MKYVNRPETFYALARGLVISGGATASLDGEVLTAGVSVSCRPDLEYTFTPTSTFMDMTQIQQWLQTLPPLTENAALGIWQDPEGLIYLDVVHIYNNDQLDQALAVAATHNQRSIYHLERGELIWI